MNLTTIKWTLAEYHQMIETGILAEKHVELIQGDIIPMAPEGEIHAYTSDEAGEYLVYLLGDRAKVRQGKPISLPTTQSEPEPDLAIVKRLGNQYRHHHPTPDDIFWVIEYSDSTFKKDTEIKNFIYAEAGIPEYWIINLKTTELIILRDPIHTGYQSQMILTQGIIIPLAFPDLEVKIERLLGL